MRSDEQIDAFDGVFDDPDRGVRELVRNGKVVATVMWRAINETPLLRQLGMNAPFGSHPARPAVHVEIEGDSPCHT